MLINADAPALERAGLGQRLKPCGKMPGLCRRADSLGLCRFEARKAAHDSISAQAAEYHDQTRVLRLGLRRLRLAERDAAVRVRFDRAREAKRAS